MKRLRKTISTTALLAGLLPFGLSAGAKEAEPGLTGAPALQVPLGARALGMGGAFTAVASDASALYYNPAGLSRLHAHELSAAFFSGQADNDQQYVAYGGPIPWPGISGNGYASAGGSFLNSRNGVIEINETRPDGSLSRSERISAGYDIVATAGYAERLGSHPLELPVATAEMNHFAGVSGKVIYSTLVQKYKATALAGDAGYIMSVPELGVSLGLAALNMGSRLAYQNEGDPLPLLFRLGTAIDRTLAQRHAVTVAGDAEYLYYEREWHANLGLEYIWNKDYSFRIGHQFKRDTLGITAGFGIRLKRRILMDYAWALGAGLSDLHRLTVTYRFGGVTQATRSSARRPYIDTAPEREPLQEREPRQERDLESPIIQEPPRRPRPTPREERPAGVPNWIY